MPLTDRPPRTKTKSSGSLPRGAWRAAAAVASVPGPSVRKAPIRVQGRLRHLLKAPCARCHGAGSIERGGGGGGGGVGGMRWWVRAAAAAAEDGEAEVLDGGEGGHRVGVLVAGGRLKDLAHHELGLGDHRRQHLHFVCPVSTITAN